MKLKQLKTKTRNKSIKTKLISIILSFVVVCSLVIGAITSYLNYKTANDILKSTILETTIQASQNASQKIKNLKNAAIQTGIMKEISDPNISVEQKQSIITTQEKLYGLSVGHILDLNGIDLFNKKDYSERDGFKVALSGEAYVSSPIISKTTGELIMLVSAPIWENGVQGSNIVGVVTFNVDIEFLSDIINDAQIGENGYAYLLDKEGTTIGDKDLSLVGVKNTIKESETDESLKVFADLDKKLISGERGSDHVDLNSGRWILGYAPVENSDGWSIGIMVAKDDFLAQMYNSIKITVILIVVFAIIAFIIGRKISNKIVNPLKECSERLNKLAQGDLSSKTIDIDDDDEIGLVAKSTNKIVKDLSEMINILVYLLNQISDGNLDIKVDENIESQLFVNGFEPISISLIKIIDNLNYTLSQINISSDQVAQGSNQLVEASQSLSQGATEQASAVEELSSTINDLSNKINQTAQNATKAKEITKKSSISTDKGKSQMEEMILAMKEIESTSNQIGNIIKAIDDIAFQTNILALNAAVEAARAGNAGKGFAVVAEEVRNLAQKSAQSAKDTEDLIRKSIFAIKNGTEIVSETEKALQEVVDGAKESQKIIQEISDATNEQAYNINQVNIGIEQISTVVQTNSANAEESAAASEELSSQAQMLKDLIGQFNIKQENEFNNDIKFDI